MATRQEKRVETQRRREELATELAGLTRSVVKQDREAQETWAKLSPNERTLHPCPPVRSLPETLVQVLTEKAKASPQEKSLIFQAAARAAELLSKGG